MNEKEQQLNLILTKIVKEISITSTMMDKAIKSYEAVGKWLGDGIEYDVRITPQGSMNLGVTNKPISDKDDYDIDLVCLLEDGQQLEAKDIKNIVGDRLKENETYLKKIVSEGEGKRCWKMQYNEFHMDILPCVPKTYYLEPDLTNIRLTHKVSSSIYEDRFSNPYGYRKWFESCMVDILKREKRAFAVENKLEIENVPTYRVKTPLQMVIQLMKRHRDIYFQNNNENAPISIIITTLAAKAYNGEENVYDAICSILHHMDEFIEIKNGIYWVQNPVMKDENFADKWQQYPERKSAFYRWLNKAKEDFITNPLNAVGMDSLAKVFKNSLGEAPVKRAFNNYADDMLKARNNGTLYSAGLTSGITTKATSGATKVKGHTFFGE